MIRPESGGIRITCPIETCEPASTKLKGLTDVAKGDAVALEGGFQTLHRLDHSLATEGKSFVMDGQEVVCAGIVGHSHGLFGRTVGAKPWLISADRHDGQIVGSAGFQILESIGQSGVAAKKDFFAAALDHVAVITAIAIQLPASAPMFDFEGANLGIPISCHDTGSVSPAKRLDFAQPGSLQEIARAGGRHNLRIAGQEPQGRWIEVIHVRMGKEDEIDRWQFIRFKAGRDQTFRADVAEHGIGSGAFAEDRIGKNSEAEEVDQHRRMSEPGGSNAVRIPGVRQGFELRLKNRPSSFGDEAFERAGRQEIG